MKPSVKSVYEELFFRYPALTGQRENVLFAFEKVKEAFLSGHTLFVCGNGGSDSDARHIVGELRKCFRIPRPVGQSFAETLSSLPDGEYLAQHLERGLPALCLNENSSLVSAYENDAAPDAALAQSLFGLAKKGDVLLCISTSGNSRNCVLATEAAKAIGAGTLALTGERDSKLSALCDGTVQVPEKETFKVQELHLPVYHCLCAMWEEEFFG